MKKGIGYVFIHAELRLRQFVLSNALHIMRLISTKYDE